MSPCHSRFLLFYQRHSQNIANYIHLCLKVYLFLFISASLSNLSPLYFVLSSYIKITTTMSSSTTEKERPNSVEDFGSNSENEAAPPPQPPRRQRRTRQRTAVDSKTISTSSTSNSNLAALDQPPVPSAVGDMANTAGNVPSSMVDMQQPAKGKSDALRLRLDLNLDIELTLKAKIHGSLELTLL
jgi:hypothetical protein